MSETSFYYQNPFPLQNDKTEYYLLTNKYISIIKLDNHDILKIDKEGLILLMHQAFHDVSFMLSTTHQQNVANILYDKKASNNDKYVALQLLYNSEISAKGILPICQDTGTAIVIGEKGQYILTYYNDKEAISKGIYQTYVEDNLRYSQYSPINIFEEVNTNNNLPAQIDIYSTCGDEYNFLCIAKGGGSANKTQLYQENKSLLTYKKLKEFLIKKMYSLGTSACPPYHIVFVIGGTSAESNLKTVKMASAKYYDTLPIKGNLYGQAFRDIKLENELLEEAQNIGFGAQFGGKYFAHDIRIIRLPRHGASCPIGMGVSCSADRNIKAKINRHGIWIEKLEKNPGKYIPTNYYNYKNENKISINLNCSMKEILEQLTIYKVGTSLLLNGTIILARDIVHAKIKDLIDNGKNIPSYFIDHPIYYAGPAKQPKGYKCGSLGPTTAGRMDDYINLFQSKNASMITIAKGNRNKSVVESCKQYGGFYLGSIGGVAALLTHKHIKKIKCIEYHELGMEAVWQIEVENFPVFILIDDKGNDFFNLIT